MNDADRNYLDNRRQSSKVLLSSRKRRNHENPCVCVMAALVFVNVDSNAQTSKASEEVVSVASLRIQNLDIKEANIHLVLARLAYKYKIPIGLEVAKSDNLLEGKDIHITIKDGAIRDALEEIIKQKPQYEWRQVGDVINVRPKEEDRDFVVRTILETKLKKLSLPRASSRLHLRQALSEQAQLNPVLARAGVSFSLEVFTSYEIQPLGRKFSLEAANLTVAEILDEIVRSSDTKYWFINRYGDRREYVLINF